MPLPPYLMNATIILCERLLREADGVLSAIRMVDVFFVPEPKPDTPDEALVVVQFYILTQFKTVPQYTGKHSVQVKLITTKGELKNLLDVPQWDSQAKYPEAPGGFTAAIQMGLRVKNLGTCYFCAYIDNEEVARTPLTIRPPDVTPLPQSPEAPLLG